MNVTKAGINCHCYCLRTDGMIRNPLVRGFVKQGFAALESYATKTEDAELLVKIKIVKSYGHMLLSHIPKIRAKCVKDSFMAGMYDMLF